MAISKVSENENELVVKIDNGDLAALNNIKGSWKFIDKEKALRFALAILTKALASGKKIYIEEGENKVALKPADDLLEKESPKESSE